MGILYVVFNDAPGKPSKRTLSYLRMAIEASVYTRRAVPRLPTALATNVVYMQSKRSAFTLVQPLHAMGTPEAWLPGGRRLGAMEWSPRLVALAAAPFALTLSMDSHAVGCDATLHAALLAELAHGVVDVAFNVEAMLGLPAHRSVEWVPSDSNPMLLAAATADGRVFNSRSQ